MPPESWSRGPLEDYASALAALESPEPLEQTSVLAMLLSRDSVARFLEKQDSVNLSDMLKLVELDRLFRDNANRLTALVSDETLERWRASAQGSNQAWWWRIYATAQEDSTTTHPVWPATALILMTACLTSTNLLFRRIFPGETLSLLSQAGATLIAGSTLTQPVQRWIDRVLFRLGQPASSHSRWYAVLSASALFLSLLPWLGLSAVARHYNEEGARLAQAGLSGSAVQSLQKAVALKPDYAPAHYDLAAALENARDYDTAIREYENAIRLDSKFLEAYNNVARLYLLRKKDPDTALQILNGVLQSPANSAALQANPRLHYSLLKNRAWANFQLGYYSLARSDLQLALSRVKEGAGAYCLEAELLEKQQQPTGSAWEDCLRYQHETEDVEPDLLNLAMERTGTK